jgi:gluconolactonase
LLFTDIPSSRIMRYTPSSGECVVFISGTNEANGMTLDRHGRHYVCEGGMRTAVGRRIVRYLSDGRREVLADRFEGKKLNEPNDLIVDSLGRVWFTDPCYGDRSKMELDHESVYRLDPRPDGTYAIARVTFDITRPNGLLLSPDGRTLYVAESPSAPDGIRQLRAYPVDPDGSLGRCSMLQDFGPDRGIDGMRIDNEGNIIATAGWTRGGPGPRIAVFSPTGQVLAEHALPEPPTNCCFGDDDLRTLYVTTLEGSLFRARTDRQGVRLHW